MIKRTSFYPLSALLLIFVFSIFVSAQNEKKIAHGVLIDNTSSLRTQFPQVLLLSKGVVKYTHQRGAISLFSFTTQGKERYPLAVVSSGVEWSQDKNVLDRYIDSLAVITGQTTLMDAIHSIAEDLNAKANLDKGAYSNKVIILISDGEDRVSKVKEKQLLKALKESGIRVYAIGLVQELDAERGVIIKSPREKAVEFLKKITKETGGRVIFPKSNQVNIDSLLSELLTE